MIIETWRKDDIWGDDMHGVMRKTAENWADDREELTHRADAQMMIET